MLDLRRSDFKDHWDIDTLSRSVVAAITTCHSRQPWLISLGHGIAFARLISLLCIITHHCQLIMS